MLTWVCSRGFGAPIWSMSDPRESWLNFLSEWRATSSIFLGLTALLWPVLCGPRQPPVRQAGRHFRPGFWKAGQLVQGHAARAELGWQPCHSALCPALTPERTAGCLGNCTTLFILQNVFQIPETALRRIFVTQALRGLGTAGSGLGEEADTRSLCPDSCHQISPFHRLLLKSSNLLPGPRQLEKLNEEMLSLFSPGITSYF